MSCCTPLLVQGSIGVDIIMTVRDCDGVLVPLADVVGPVLLRVKLNSAATVERNATVFDIPTSKVKYTTVNGDFPSAGHWKAMLVVTFPGGRTIKSSKFTIEVEEAI